MKIKRFGDINEGVKDKMTPKSEDDIMSSISKLTPWGMYGKMMESEIEDKRLEKIAKQRIKESEKELDDIFEKYQNNEDLKKLVSEVVKWIKRYGGNQENIESYGYTEMADTIWRAGVQWRHDVQLIYDDTVFKSFRELLKNVAICETKYNNIDYNFDLY